MVTFRFATTGRRSKRGYAGVLTIHFHGDKLAGLNRSYEHEQAVADRLSGSTSTRFAVSSCNFASRDDFADPETGTFIAVEATYDVEYARR